MTPTHPTPSLRRTARRLAIAAALVATAGAAAAPAASASEPPVPRTYLVTADLDGRNTPSRNDVAIIDFLRKGERVFVECQAYGGLAYGSRWWDLVSKDGETLFVPDRYIRTGTSGEAPGIRLCTEDELNE